jgi:hypothetical protein
MSVVPVSVGEAFHHAASFFLAAPAIRFASARPFSVKLCRDISAVASLLFALHQANGQKSPEYMSNYLAQN